MPVSSEETPAGGRFPRFLLAFNLTSPLPPESVHILVNSSGGVVDCAIDAVNILLLGVDLGVCLRPPQSSSSCSPRLHRRHSFSSAQSIEQACPNA